ncbi:hypothetical protein R3P38DRAFT_3255198 [Favolaschia claudopus]|uniref:F-box domain-containing protein n=1 Tax=Favolaschia claudopus TaxID=2862362 RepID=A0AAW0DMI4_9AGAR
MHVDFGRDADSKWSRIRSLRGEEGKGGNDNDSQYSTSVACWDATSILCSRAVESMLMFSSELICEHCPSKVAFRTSVAVRPTCLLPLTTSPFPDTYLESEQATHINTSSSIPDAQIATVAFIPMQLFEIPDILERLRHSDIPSDVEIHKIRDSIAMAQSSIVALQSQAPTAETEDLSKYVAQYSSLLSPIRRLPLDILRTIFLDPIANQGELRLTRHSILVHCRPNSLGAVCYHWRCVSLETAMLWSSLLIYPNQPNRYTIDGLRIALQRSQKAPLHLAFRPALSSSWSALGTEMMQEVCSHSERWASVEISFDPQLLRQLSPVENKLDSLQTLTIVDIDPYYSVNPRSCKVFAHAPKLRTLRLIQIHLHSPSGAILPWQQFTRLYIDARRVDPGSYRSVLSQAPNLRELFVRLPEAIRESDRRDEHPIILHHLREMHVYTDGGPDDVQVDVLKQSTALALKKLVLGCLDTCKLNISTVSSFLGRSSAQLHTLELNGTSVRAVHLISLLRMVPTVERLVLRNLLPYAVTNPLIQALTIGASSADKVLLPMMTSFHLGGGYLFKADVLISMLESRLTPSDEFSQLIAIDIVLPITVVPVVRLMDFAIAARRASAAFHFVCLNQAQKAVAMEFAVNALYDDVCGASFGRDYLA